MGRKQKEIKMDKLSVIVPVYNAENYLDRCINSILNQTYENIEIILVDDGSTDESSAICDRFADNSDKVKVIHVTNGGPARGRNIGLRQATGRFVAFVDADDYIEPDMYSTLIKELVSSNVQMVVCNWFIHKDGNNCVEKSNIGKSRIVHSDELKETILSNDVSCGGGYPWNRIIDTAILKQHNNDPVFFRENLFFYEDKVWIIELSPYIERTKLLDYTGYHYLIHNSLSHQQTPQKMRNMLEAWKAIEALEKDGLNLSAREKRDREVRGAVFWLLRNGERKEAAQKWAIYRHNYINLRKINFKKPKQVLSIVLLEINYLIMYRR